MNQVDIAIAVLCMVAAVLGFRSGAIPQLGGLLGAGLGAFAALGILSAFSADLAGLEPQLRVFLVLGGILVSVVTGEGIGGGIGRAIGTRLGRGLLGAADRVLGAVVGVAQGVLVVWLAGWLLAAGIFPQLTAAAQGSTAVRTISAALPPPTAFTGRIERLLDAAGLPDLFVGLDPIPAAPVDLPADAAIRAVAAAASASTFRVSADTCGLRSSGSAVAIRADYLVTNAHVVAGTTGVLVTGPGDTGAEHEAVVVLYDSDLDVAVLRVPGLGAVPLAFATANPERGAPGVTLGYPGGGALDIEPAAVTTMIDAVGLDVTGTHEVTRRVLELRATIDRGDSGGPFILLDGTIGGLVFAESRVDSAVGYALSPVAVAATITPGLSRSAPVDTGACRP